MAVVVSKQLKIEDNTVHIVGIMRHCKHLQRSQSHSVENFFAPWWNKISALTLVPNQH